MQKCNLIGFLGSIFLRFPIPAMKPKSVFEKCYESSGGYHEVTEEVIKRLEYELDVSRELVCQLFLIIWDL